MPVVGLMATLTADFGPRKALIPLLIMLIIMGDIIKAANGAAHHQPNRVFLFVLQSSSSF
jgi:hypothetical protein